MLLTQGPKSSSEKDDKQYNPQASSLTPLHPLYK